MVCLCFSWWVPSGWELVVILVFLIMIIIIVIIIIKFKMIIIIMIMVILVVLAIWVCSLRRLHTVWERTLNYTQVLVKTKNLEDLIIII